MLITLSTSGVDIEVVHFLEREGVSFFAWHFYSSPPLFSILKLTGKKLAVEHPSVDADGETKILSPVYYSSWKRKQEGPVSR